MGTYIIIAALLVICVLAVRSYRKKLSSGCCGTGDAPAKRAKVADTDEAHYPYVQTLKVEQMHCKNCVNAIENTLNAMPGTWASANLADKTVRVRSKTPISEDALTAHLQGAGYGGAYLLHAE